MTHDDHEQWVSTKEAGRYINVSIITIRRWIAEREFPAVKCGKSWRCKLSEVDKWMQAQNEQAKVEKEYPY